MRSLSVNRPRQKVRNPGRHLKALSTWAEGFQGIYPPRGESRFVNFKLPVPDRLVEGPTSRFAWRRIALNRMLAAAENLIRSRPAEEEGKSRVALLIQHPQLWSSEVTVFFDLDYLATFIPPPEKAVDFSLAKHYDLELNASFSEHAYDVTWEDEDTAGNPITIRQRHITIMETMT